MPLEYDASYECPYCGEANYLGVDIFAGRVQTFIEDCPVCCSPIAFTVAIDPAGDVTIRSAERDD
ncbi:MAG TPA: CPXCG motif-containing cysteine-rich protein [Candidatus Baltobacteraceae bacterium]|nr:CPXCG motif-containing cysteine-rich protein [Candidatus Baltobacteraceae bacterium]